MYRDNESSVARMSQMDSVSVVIMGNEQKSYYAIAIESVINYWLDKLT